SNETCGNGIVDAVNGEQCDDGNSRGRDGCSKCLLEQAVVIRPGGAPPGRHSELLVYDGARQRVVMFGGYTLDGPLGDTWEWDGTTWTLLSPATKPGARAGARMVFDSTNKYVVMFGGCSPCYTDSTIPQTAATDNHTWTWNGTTWSDKGALAGPTVGWDANGMAFDANLGKVVVWGGATSTYEWSGAAWTAVALAVPTRPRGN